MRKIPNTLVILGLLTPLVTPVEAGALGIGDIKVRSNLNQALVAEIPLVTSGSDTLSDIRINLASPEAFAQAGIDRQYFLSKLVFKAVQKSEGTYIIQVTSREPISEPFLNFLLEVNWPQGHLLREFTALLDPPVAYDEKAFLTQARPEVTKPTEESTPSAHEPAVANKRAKTARATPSIREKTQTSLEPAQGTSSTYGPIQKKESLWKIARSLSTSPTGSPDRLMRALYDANPNAFVNGDINRLKTGITLVVPGVQIQQQPASRIEDQAGATTSPPPVSTKYEKEEPKGAKLKLFNAPEEKTSTEPVVPTPAATATETAISTEPSLPAPSEAKPQPDATQARLNELEQKLSALQGLLNIKDRQIADLQSAQQQVEPPATHETKVSTSPITTLTSDQPNVTIKSPLPSGKITDKHPELPSDKASFNWMPEPYYLAVGGAGTILLGALIWVMYRRRTAMLDDYESMFPRDAQESAFSEIYANQRPSEAKSTVADPNSGSKSSFLVEFSASDFDALDTESDELDPISEADVYLAYGRYKQAEELIRNAIKQHPDRDECKLKLLEIHYATENRTAFEGYSKDLYSQKKDSDPDFWGKVLEMGRELCPDSPLFPSGEFESLDLERDEINDLQPSTISQVFDRITANSEPTLHSPPKATDPTFSAEPLSLGNHTFNVRSDHSSELANQLELDLKAAESTSEPFTKRKVSSLVENSQSGNSKDPMSLDFDFELLPGTDDGTRITDKQQNPAIPGIFGDLTDMNELETKLDLAKAFVDMDDTVSAREILEEVVKEGNDAQKEEARNLLAKIE